MLAPRKKLWSTPSNVLDVVCQWIELKPGDVVCDIGCGDGRVLIHLAENWTTNFVQQQQQQHHIQIQEGGDEEKPHNESNINEDLTTTTKTAAAAAVVQVSFLGLDINPERIQEANAALEIAKMEGRINPDLVKIKFHCANAMQAIDLYHDATHFFLYLIPRGLKIFKPILFEILHKNTIKTQQQQQQQQQQKKPEQKQQPQQLVNNDDGDNNHHHHHHHHQNTTLVVMTYMSPLPGEKFSKKQLCEVEHQPGAAWPVYLYHLTQPINGVESNQLLKTDEEKSIHGA